MEINVERIEIEIQKLNRIIKEYESNYLNIKKCFNSISFFWKDNNSHKYFDEVYDQQKQIDISLIELKDLKELYKYIASQYKTLGKRVKYMNSNKNKILMMIDQYKDNMTEIIRLYDETNTYNIDNRIVVLMEKERRRIMSNKEKIIDYRSRIVDLFNNLELIEQRINRKINDIDVTIL